MKLKWNTIIYLLVAVLCIAQIVLNLQKDKEIMWQLATLAWLTAWRVALWRHEI